MYLLEELRNRFSNTDPPQSLTILRNDHLGDLVLTLPLLRQAEDWLGPGNVTAVVDTPYPPLLERLPLSLSVDTDDGGHWKQLGETLRNTGADTLITAASKTRNALASQYSGIKQRLGFGYKLSMIFYTNPLFRHRKNPPIHESEFCLEYLRMLPDAPTKPPELPGYRATRDDRKQAETVLNHLGLQNREYVIVHPGHSESANHFTPEQYRMLIEDLQENQPVLLTGKGDEERDLLKRLQKNLPNAVALKQDLSLPVFARIIEEAQIYIGGSSGPLHLASLVGTRRLGLYSNDPRYQPAKWKPLGDNQVILTPPKGVTLDSMNPEGVLDTIRKNFLDAEGLRD
ncbi:MAG: glycosyltransferase family 9 protein [bacterium]